MSGVCAIFFCICLVFNSIPSERIRVAMENFLQLPFGVQRFHLAGIKPTTLRVSLLEEKAELK